MGGEAELEHDQTLEATLNKREGGGLDHLVCDFNDLDAEKTIKDYEEITIKCLDSPAEIH